MQPARYDSDTAGTGASEALQDWLTQEDRPTRVAEGAEGLADASVASPSPDRLASGWWIVPVLLCALPVWAVLLRWLF